MKKLGLMAAAFAVLLVVFLGLQVVASESGEVVVLHTEDGAGGAATRLWVVDYQDHQWLRSGGGASSGWYGRLAAAPRVELERGEERRPYVAVVEPAMAGMVNQLMAEKYGWRDRVVGLLAGDRAAAVAVRLVPADAAGSP